MLKFVEHFYHHVRNTIIWFVIYFALQTIIWVALGVVILMYPAALFILVAIFFVLFAAVNLYFMALFIRCAIKLKHLKDLVSF
ncbi:hypothetical protein HZB94_04480 [Candidatus Falkowbacteria bacterium]|nr:hypothetical protein [Candidatus Falkowbacteria bacterium]